MEYLSLPHTRASTHKLVPEVSDELLTNLRNPIITFVEDTSPGAHDTLTAACDANQYTALGIEKPEEHGSCAENLVLALKELNETAGLKGAKAVGADISVNIAPTPLHLFMNAPLHFEHADPQGAGAQGITLKVEEPQGKKRAFVRFRAERDVVVVLSACPMDVGKQNGGRCMAANFMVEDLQEEEDLAALVSEGKRKKGPKKLAQKGGDGGKTLEANNPKEDRTDAVQEDQEATSFPKDKTSGTDPTSEQAEKKAPKKLASKRNDTVSVQDTSETKQKQAHEQDEAPSEEPKPKKKPRKLQQRTAGDSVTSTKSS